MELSVGSIFEGKVTGLTKFGAFISLPNGKTGMVHISEVANTYVNDISEHLTEGQVTQVKVISIDEASGRINLSIKKALPEQPAPPARQRQSAPQNTFTNRAASSANRTPVPKEATFEDRLKQFMTESDSKISRIKQYSDKRSSSKRKK